jgi:hypothetical protein
MESEKSTKKDTVPVSITFGNTTQERPHPVLSTTSTQDDEKTNDQGQDMNQNSGVDQAQTQGMSSPYVNSILPLIEAEKITNPASNKASMNTIPTEVILRIFELLPVANATCLGLTCGGLYACLKTKYPRVISLGFTECCDWDYRGTYHSFWEPLAPACDCSGWGRFPKFTSCLWQRLETWMGPTYTLVFMDLSSQHILRFVKTSVYGDQMSYDYFSLPDPPELIGPLRQRYKDWDNAGNGLSVNDASFRSLLPHPLNKGKDWHPEAISAIKADIARCDDLRKWRRFWSRFWVFLENTEEFRKFLEICRLKQIDEALEEGFKLLGL